MRVVIRRPDGTLYTCGTNAMDPSVNILDVHYLFRSNFFKESFQGSTMDIIEGAINGAAICPVDPDDRSTAVWVGECFALM